MIKTQSLAF